MANHEHHHDENYFLDQICMVALSGAFGVVCLSMYFFRSEMLFRLLGQQFHLYVLASGIILVLIALVRASVLWVQAGRMTQNNGIELANNNHDVPAAEEGCCPGNEHSHHHGEHSHAHSHGGHSHGHSHSAEPEHGHSHAVIAHSHAFGHKPEAPGESGHSHAHSHSHENGADHEHGWAPWRYVVLLLPIILYMLGLPSKGPSINPHDLKIIQLTPEERSIGAVVAGLTVDPWAAFSVAAVVGESDSALADARLMNVKTVEAWAADEADRAEWKGKAISVRGQFMPRNDRMFSVVRFRIQCCQADAIQLSIPVLAKESVGDIKQGEWIQVTGRVDFRQSQGKYVTGILVSRSNHVQPCPPDLNPYVQ